MSQTKITNQDIVNPWSGNTTLGSGSNFLNSSSGINNLGSAANPFNTVYANNFVGTGIASNITGFIAASGGTMTGPLNLTGTAGFGTLTSGVGNIGAPSLPLNTIYANNIIAGGYDLSGPFVHISGDTMTGTLIIAGASALIVGGGAPGTSTTSFSLGNNAFAHGQYSLAAGFGASTGPDSNDFAFGFQAYASGGSAFAGGWNAQAIGSAATSMGYATIASGTAAIAYGNTTKALAQYSTAEGSLTTTYSNSSHVGGTSNTLAYTALNSVMYGELSYGTGANSITVGDTIQNYEPRTAAFGYQTLASGLGYNIYGGINNSGISAQASIIGGQQNGQYGGGGWSIVGGYNNILNASSYNAVIGQGNLTSSSNNNAVFGSNNAITNSSSNNSVAGYSNTLYGVNFATVAGYSNTLYGVNFATVGGQSNTVSGLASFTAVFGQNIQMTGNPFSIAAGGNHQISSVFSSTFGNSNTNFGNFSTVIGQQNTSSNNANSSFTAGSQNFNDADHGFVIGQNNSNIGGASGSIIGGFANYNTAFGSIVGGSGNSVSGSIIFCMGSDHIVLASANEAYVHGTNNTLGGFQSFAHGNYANASGNNTFALGTYISALGSGSVVVGNNAVATATGTMILTDYQTSTYSGTTANAMYLRFQNGVNLVSGTSLLPTTSGTQNIGSAALPFSNIYAQNINGINSRTTVWNEIPSGSINSSNKTYTILHAPYSVGGIQLYKNGSYMAPSGIGAPYFDFSVTGTTITFVTAPASGSIIIANYQY